MEKIIASVSVKSSAILLIMDEQNWPIGIISISKGKKQDITRKIIAAFESSYMEPTNIKVCNVRSGELLSKNNTLTNKNIINFDIESIEDGESSIREFILAIIPTY